MAALAGGPSWTTDFIPSPRGPCWTTLPSILMVHAGPLWIQALANLRIETRQNVLFSGVNFCESLSIDIIEMPKAYAAGKF